MANYHCSLLQDKICQQANHQCFSYNQIIRHSFFLRGFGRKSTKCSKHKLTFIWKNPKVQITYKVTNQSNDGQDFTPTKARLLRTRDYSSIRDTYQTLSCGGSPTPASHKLGTN